MNKIYCKKKITGSSKRKFLLSYFSQITPETFWDVECTNSQCSRTKNRSIGDIKMLLDGRFKKKTPIEDVIFLLVDLVLKESIKALFCPDINKLVFFNKTRPYYYFCDNPEIDAPRRTRKGTDGYSWVEVLEIHKNKTK